MRSKVYYVMQVGAHWEVRLMGLPSRTTHSTGNAALAAALSAAQDLWSGSRTHCEVRMCNDDDSWHVVTAFGNEVLPVSLRLSVEHLDEEMYA